MVCQLQEEVCTGRGTETVPEEEEIDEEKTAGAVQTISEDLNSINVSDESAEDKPTESEGLTSPVTSSQASTSPASLTSQVLGKPPKSPKSPRSPVSPRYLKMFPRSGASIKRA